MSFIIPGQSIAPLTESRGEGRGGRGVSGTFRSEIWSVSVSVATAAFAGWIVSIQTEGCCLDRSPGVCYYSCTLIISNGMTHLASLKVCLFNPLLRCRPAVRTFWDYFAVQ